MRRPESGLGQTKPFKLQRPFGRRITQGGDADAARPSLAAREIECLERIGDLEIKVDPEIFASQAYPPRSAEVNSRHKEQDGNRGVELEFDGNAAGNRRNAEKGLVEIAHDDARVREKS